MKVSGPPEGGFDRQAKPVGRTSTAGSSPSPRSAAASSAAAPPLDVTLLAGVPEAELTPKVREALLALLEEVQRLRAELEQSRKRIAFLETLSDQDALLPMINRRAFVRELSRHLSLAERYGANSSVIYLDLDAMKRINDRYGHAAGDAVLQHVARLLLDSVRSSDIVGRLGGDEFGIILINASRPDAERKAALLARRLAETPFTWEGEAIALSLSWGVYDFSGGEDADQTLRAADAAMYANKRGRP